MKWILTEIVDGSGVSPLLIITCAGNGLVLWFALTS
jgi:hypothetical protein